MVSIKVRIRDVLAFDLVLSDDIHVSRIYNILQEDVEAVLYIVVIYRVVPTVHYLIGEVLVVLDSFSKRVQAVKLVENINSSKICVGLVALAF